MKAPQRILVPIDMSVFSMTALQYAQDIAEYFGAEIILLHVIESKSSRRETDQNLSTDRHVKAAITHMLLDHNIVMQSVRIELRQGQAAPVIVKAVQDFRIDLIVICTHGRTGLGHLLMGSVAEKIVRHASCPVLTIRPDEFRELINVTEGDISEGLHLS